ncbi:hypothetical protein K3N28_01195 [Glycomyces sp. TRM65418]|uniref:hypothetical protein n=1 Tax=Glycomyces sp. TRM65418 TaxID=2867006 RepID=UPI001CE52B3B|nr:hypothetical protein [Glycomyces sp. TRM65418]MCC3761689.1 hypothetical protein [Glycomyces sp. TRM65418]QZD55782.1 hypothetical protein K3N28_01185 [Glycomyces sp. TRM65418]
MLPQPNFGRDKDPVGPDEDADDAMPRRKLLRLQIAMWIQVVCAVIAGNILAFYTFSLRGATVEDLQSIYEGSDAVDDPAATAQQAFELYQSTNFMVSNLVIAGFAIVAAIIGALCAIRFKTRLKVVRWWAVGATAVLFIIGMFMSTVFGLYVAPWVFASVLALWWLFSSDIRYWLSESGTRRAKAGEAED